MTIFTIGFTQKSAEVFFERLKQNHIEILIDIRLNNKSQLAGFTKENDLKYFLKEICNCDYDHRIDLAPTQEILEAYKKGNIDWERYGQLFLPLLQERKIESFFLEKFGKYNNICLLCSEKTAERCHRRLVAEYLAENSNKSIIIKHI